MSSEDVIELGSSDEEAEPEPKKKKPTPNAMVCIPGNLGDVTIKPTKTKPVNLPRGLGKALTIKKVVSGKKTLSTTERPMIKKGGLKIVPAPKMALNPFSQIPQTSVMLPNKPNINKVTIFKPGPGLQNTVLKPAIPLLTTPIQIANPRAFNLPSSITVKKTSLNRPILILNKNKNLQPVNQRINTAGNFLTVELDDDEAPVTNTNPVWYLRPEEQIEKADLKEENDKEPDSTKMIEITIEDSPVKPLHNKRTHELGAELPITIDDSPVKAVVDKNNAHSGTESEGEHSSDKVPDSKKKLEYPKKVDNRIEIEIALNNNCHVDNTVTLVEEDKNPKEDTSASSTQNKSDLIESGKETKNTEPSEFHPVYQSFIDLCFKLENSDDMKKIVEKKIKGYYKQVPKEYTESEEFLDMVSSKILSMKAGPEKMYLYIKDIVDELNMQRKMAKSQPIVTKVTSEEPVQEYRDENEYDSKRQRQIRKLEKTIKKLHRAIQKLEDQEVDFDDEDDSVYLLTERYKERMVRVYAKFCQLSNTKMPSEPRIHIEARPGQPLGPAKRLEKWINKKVPIGTPLPFPDFHDVIRCVREANDEDKLGLNEADIIDEARDLFTRCGKKLQRRRQENEWRLAASRITTDVDPAENNDQLKLKLNENRTIAATRENEIFNKFADRQKQLKLEAEEIGDKEAEESPVESEEEEEANDENVSLNNAEKRKESLRRLLQEKTKKTSEEKENQPSNEDQKNESAATVTEETATVVETEDGDLKSDSKKDAQDNVTPTEAPSNKDDDIIQDACELENDENDLLQKLYSGDEHGSSSADSLDSDIPISISDSTASSDDDTKHVNDDVISIENSSYSEDEREKEDDAHMIDDTEVIDDNSMGSLENETVPVEEHAMDVETEASVHRKNDQYNEEAEDILLASSAEENSQEESAGGTCINLRDDLISIDETVIGKVISENKTVEIASINNEHSNSLNAKKHIENEAMLPKDDEVEVLQELVGNHKNETVWNNGHKLNDSVENMNVDQDSGIVIKSTESLATKNNPTTSEKT